MTKDTEIYLKLRADILTMAISPGVRLVEEEICRRFSATRTPVRHALRRLQQEGLVLAEPYCGCKIRQIDVIEGQQILEIREVLEGLAARIIATSAVSADIDSLAELAGRVDTYAVNGNWAAYFDADRVFHDTVIKCSGNAKLFDILEVTGFQLRCFALYDRYLLAIVSAIHRADASGGHRHSALVSAMASRDPDKAERMMREHIREARLIIADAASMAGPGFESTP